MIQYWAERCDRWLYKETINGKLLEIQVKLKNNKLYTHEFFEYGKWRTNEYTFEELTENTELPLELKESILGIWRT